MKATRKKKARFKVGDWVAFLYGTRNLFAQVIEERGPLGVNGRHIVRIQVDGESNEPDAFELPEDYLEAAPVPDKVAIIRYLTQGGLLAILSSNLSGRRNQRKVWLTYTHRGDVTPTFIAERGVIGGATVPFSTLHEDRVFPGKEAKVASFLASFGLDEAAAHQIIKTVGTAP